MSPERCSVGEYLTELLASTAPLAVESVPLDEALGRITATDLRAAQPVPLFDNSAMDGFAVRSADVVHGSREHPVWLRVLATATAGAPADAVIAQGDAVQIMTGAPLPPGADRVIPVESTVAARFDDSRVVGVWAGQKAHVRRAAEDIAAGALLIEAGRALGARDIGLLAATGHTRVSVHRRPRVAILSTGDELLAQAGGIPDSNALYLAAAVRAVGVEVGVRVVARDDLASVEAALDRAAGDGDLIVSTGGLGAGSHDLVRRAIVAGARAGAGGRWTAVDMKPGRPQAHGSWAGVPWIALPGNPTATFVSFEAFVRPVLDRMGGRRGTAAAGLRDHGVPGKDSAGPTRFVPLTVSGRDGDAAVLPSTDASHAAHSLSAMFSAPLIGMVGPEVDRLRAGDLVVAFEPA